MKWKSLYWNNTVLITIFFYNRDSEWTWHQNVPHGALNDGFDMKSCFSISVQKHLLNNWHVHYRINDKSIICCPISYNLVQKKYVKSYQEYRKSISCIVNTSTKCISFLNRHVKQPNLCFIHHSTVANSKKGAPLGSLMHPPNTRLKDGLN